MEGPAFSWQRIQQYSGGTHSGAAAGDELRPQVHSLILVGVLDLPEQVVVLVCALQDDPYLPIEHPGLCEVPGLGCVGFSWGL